MPQTALIVIDVQQDFCPGGALAVRDGDAVVPVANRLMGQYEHVVLTQDWHPPGHGSFASAHPGREPFEVIEAPYGPQVLWPDHCIQATPGAAFHPDLDTRRAGWIVRKGFRPAIDSYSAFFENDRETTTGLSGSLRERGITGLVLCGLATDFCVRWTALDGRRLGYEVAVVQDAVRAIDTDGSLEATWADFREAGVALVRADDLRGYSR